MVWPLSLPPLSQPWPRSHRTTHDSLNQRGSRALLTCALAWYAIEATRNAPIQCKKAPASLRGLSLCSEAVRWALFELPLGHLFGSMEALAVGDELIAVPLLGEARQDLLIGFTRAIRFVGFRHPVFGNGCNAHGNAKRCNQTCKRHNGHSLTPLNGPASEARFTGPKNAKSPE